MNPKSNWGRAVSGDHARIAPKPELSRGYLALSRPLLTFVAVRSSLTA